MSHIIPFPKRNDPSAAQDFQPGKHVLAVYPGTTALYKATVVNTRKVLPCNQQFYIYPWEFCVLLNVIRLFARMT